MRTVSTYRDINVRLESVLIATDFSQASEKALRHGVSIARHFGAKLFLMHVVSSLGLTLAGPGAIATATNLALRDANALEEKLVKTGVLRDLRHEVIVRAGDIGTELERVVKEKHIDMVVVGTHGRGGINKIFLGSAAEQIFRNASCLVLTVGSHSPANAELESRGQTRPLLFATDFSAASVRTLPYAVSLANQRGNKLVLLHILNSVPPLEGNRWYTADDVVNLRHESVVATLQQLKDLTAHTTLAVEPEFIVQFGEPSEGILRAASELRAEAIVLGLKHRTHIDTMSHLSWTTAYKVVCEAVCPVLTVRN